MVLGIVMAMPDEVAAISGQRLAVGQSLQLTQQVQVRVSGIGAEPARQAARQLLESGATALASVGVAGALMNDLQAGEVHIPQAVVLAGRHFDVDGRWRSKLCEVLEGNMTVHAGRILHSEQAVLSAQDKHACFRDSGCLAVDMESGAIAEVAAEHNAPLLVVRSISDTANRDVPAETLEMMNSKGEVQLAAVLRILLSKPALIVPLLSLRRDYQLALGRLRQIVKVSGKDFCLQAALQ